MNYPYSFSPNIHNAMAQAMQALMTGGPLPQNCFVVTLPMQQAQPMFPQYASGGGAMVYPQQAQPMFPQYASGGGAMMYPQQPSYYGQLYQPQMGPYQINQPSNAVVPYSNYYSQGYDQNYNYPVAPYYSSDHQSKKKHRHGKKDRSEPHSNVYNSSSFDSDMRNLSWSRLFGTHHSKHKKT